jgi:ribonucleoside-triphosphate reductase
MDTFDVEVADNHWFYAGAVKSHNTLSKIADCSEGIHTPMAQYMINNVMFSQHDPLVERLAAANYKVFPHPNQNDAVLVAFPVAYPDSHFTEVDGCMVNMETAVEQLGRYQRVLSNYANHNVSASIYYTLDEIPRIVDWLHANWDSYVGTAFFPRTDPLKKAEDYGYAYLPQEVLTRSHYLHYTGGLKEPDFAKIPPEEGFLPDFGECATGACPVR